MTVMLCLLTTVMASDHCRVHLWRQSDADLVGPIRRRKPVFGWRIKKTGLPLLYWNWMLKGHEWFFATKGFSIRRRRADMLGRNARHVLRLRGRDANQHELGAEGPVGHHQEKIVLDIGDALEPAADRLAGGGRVVGHRAFAVVFASSTG